MAEDALRTPPALSRALVRLRIAHCHVDRIVAHAHRVRGELEIATVFAPSAAADYEAFARALSRRNILVAEKPLLHSALSAAHTEEHVDEILGAAEDAFAEIAGQP